MKLLIYGILSFEKSNQKDVFFFNEARRAKVVSDNFSQQDVKSLNDGISEADKAKKYSYTLVNIEEKNYIVLPEKCDQAYIYHVPFYSAFETDKEYIDATSKVKTILLQKIYS